MSGMVEEGLMLLPNSKKLLGSVPEGGAFLCGDCRFCVSFLRVHRFPLPQKTRVSCWSKQFQWLRKNPPPVILLCNSLNNDNFFFRSGWCPGSTWGWSTEAAGSPLDKFTLEHSVPMLLVFLTVCFGMDGILHIYHAGEECVRLCFWVGVRVCSLVGNWCVRARQCVMRGWITKYQHEVCFPQSQK